MTEHPVADPNAAHSIFAPSGADMWMVCAGSLLANLEAADDAGEDAAYGTVGHAVGEEWLLSGERPTHLVGKLEKVVEGENVFEILIDDEMLDYVHEYIEWCNELDGDHYVEKRVYFSELTPLQHQGGTADHFALFWQLMVITDLKMGRGVQVFAERNRQGMLYALGVFLEWDFIYNFQRIVIRICQPRLDHFDTWECTREELLAFAEEVKRATRAALVPDAPRTPTIKGCRFCKVRKNCTALASFTENLVDECFETMPTEYPVKLMQDTKYRIDNDFFMASNKIPAAAILSTEQLAKLLPFGDLIKSFFSEIYLELHKRAMQGQATPGWKLADGRMERGFRDQKAAEKALTSAGAESFDLYTMKFCSPAQAEKILISSGMKRKAATEIVAQLVVKIAGHPTLVPEDAVRRAYVSPADDAFETFED